jgi:sialate O-acetylesterase
MDRESLETFKDSLKLPVVPDLFDQNEWTKKVTTSVEKTKLRRMQISFPPKNFQFPKVNPDTLGAAWNSVDLLDKNNHFGNVVWLQKKIVISPEFVKQHLNLSLGFLSWQSQVFLNGKEIGYFPYPKPVVTVLPKDLIRSGENLLAIRLAQPWNDAQCLGNKEQYALSNPDHSFKISLSDDWLANSILEQITPVVESYPNIPAYLYNGMVAPIIPYGIKGYLWYQGEADAGRPLLYSQMFRSLITDWRKVWNQGDLPFLFFQISTYPLTHEQDKTADPWIKQREAQSTVLSLPNTGMVITYDIGDAYDIHPKNKKEFAHRLVLKALAL